MKLLESDLDQSFYQTIPKNTDTPVGYFFAIVIAILFILLVFVGMYRIQTVSDQVVVERPRPEFVIEPEISDSADSEKSLSPF